MAVSTDITVSVASGGITYDTIGLSKTLDNYTFDELWEYAYCCANSNLIYHTGEGGSNVTYMAYQANYGHIPMQLEQVGSRLEMSFPQDSSLNQPDGLYMKMAWVQRTSSGSDLYIRKSINGVNYRLITEFNAPHYVFETSTPEKVLNNYGANSWNKDNALLYYSAGGYLYYYSDVTSVNPVRISIDYTLPVFLFKFNGKNYMIFYRQGMSDFYTKYNLDVTPVTCSYARDYEDTISIAFPLTSTTMYRYYDYDTGEYSSAYSDGSNIPTGYGGYPDNTYSETVIEHIRAFYDWGGSSYYYPEGFCQTNFFKTKDESMKFFAFIGLHFKCDKIYKPIIANGYVTGYTDDLTTVSDLDGWDGDTNHHIPDEPPGPTPPGPGYDDDPWSGASFSGVGVGGAGAFAKCYYMTSTELANLRSWMNSNNVPEGFDPMAQIIGLSQVPVSLSGDDNTTVQFVNSSAVYDPGVTRLVDSGVSTQIAMGTPKKYSLGSVDIVRRMQERGEPYLDYDCQIELYLPLIGMFSLDTQAVMGRTITAEAVLDPISGTLAAYAYVSREGQNLPIAYGSTTIGVDLPISAQQYSVSRAALKQANAQLGASILSSTLSFIAAATAGGKGSGTGAKTATGSTNGLAAAGIREAGADYMKASQAGNVFGDFMQWGRTIRQLSYGNNTALAGSFGGSTAQWSYPFTPYVKIIRPRYEKPSNYAHSQGVPCVQTKTVGSCTGFIQCIGVDVSGISGATDIELQAIQAALTNGVFAGGGS